MNTNSQTQKIKQLTALAVLGAVAYVLHFVHIPVAFLNLEFKDVVIAIGGMYFGPLSGLALSVLVPLLEFPTGSTGVYGLIMNILGTATFVGVASTVYRFRRSLSGAVVGLCAAALSMTAVMMLANLWITPYYMGVSQTEVVALIPKLLLPFNGIKSILNASLTLCLYKPLTGVLRRTGFGRGSVQAAKPESVRKRSILVWVVGGVIAILSLLVIFLLLGGSVQVG